MLDLPPLEPLAPAAPPTRNDRAPRTDGPDESFRDALDRGDRAANPSRAEESDSHDPRTEPSPGEDRSAEATRTPDEPRPEPTRADGPVAEESGVDTDSVDDAPVAVAVELRLPAREVESPPLPVDLDGQPLPAHNVFESPAEEHGEPEHEGSVPRPPDELPFPIEAVEGAPPRGFHPTTTSDTQLRTFAGESAEIEPEAGPLQPPASLFTENGSVKVAVTPADDAPAEPPIPVVPPETHAAKPVVPSHRDATPRRTVEPIDEISETAPRTSATSSPSRPGPAATVATPTNAPDTEPLTGSTRTPDEATPAAPIAAAEGTPEVSPLQTGPRDARVERVAAETTRPTESTPATLENGEAIVREVARSLTGNRTLRMRLEPPELGTLSIEIVQRDGAIVARLEVDNAAAQRVLLDNSAGLGDQLAKLGHNVDRLDVELNDGRDEREQSPENDRRERHDGEADRGRNDDDEDQPESSDVNVAA